MTSRESTNVNADMFLRTKSVAFCQLLQLTMTAIDALSATLGQYLPPVEIYISFHFVKNVKRMAIVKPERKMIDLVHALDLKSV